MTKFIDDQGDKKGPLNNRFADAADAAHTQVYDKIIIGGGMAGLQSAYEILRAAKKAGKTFKVAVVADTINSPAQAGSNVVMGLDGYENEKCEDPKAFTPHDKAVLKQIKLAAGHVKAIVWKEKINCRFSSGYQMLGDDPKNVKGAADWLVDTFGYKKDSLKFVPNSRINFKGYTSAMQSDDIGQINAPEYQQGLIAAIRRMGGTVIDGVNYQSQDKTADGKIAVHTDHGTFKSTTPPLLATGAGHVASLENGKLPIEFRTIYTGAMHIQLTPEDAKKVSSDGKPMAYCDTNLAGDVIWGSLDSKGVLTMGFGDSPVSEPQKNRVALRKKFGEILPDIAGKYLDGALKNNVTYSYGGMLTAENNFPLVGRMAHFDVMTGWATRGIVQSSAASQAYAQWVVNGNDKGLKLWEGLNARCFAPVLQAGRAEPRTAVR